MDTPCGDILFILYHTYGKKSNEQAPFAFNCKGAFVCLARPQEAGAGFYFARRRGLSAAQTGGGDRLNKPI